MLVVGQYKLLEIANIDQTLIAFEFLARCIYNYKGAKTV
jgi:hypothetical protein